MTIDFSDLEARLIAYITERTTLTTADVRRVLDLQYTYWEERTNLILVELREAAGDEDLD